MISPEEYQGFKDGVNKYHRTLTNKLNDLITEDKINKNIYELIKIEIHFIQKDILTEADEAFNEYMEDLAKDQGVEDVVEKESGDFKQK